MPSIKYVELKSGFSDNGPAWIGRVSESQSGRTLYFNGKALKRASGGLGNHIDPATGDRYWVSGVKRRGTNRHWAGSGKILVEAAAVPDLLQALGTDALDHSMFAVTDDIQPTSAADFVSTENARLGRR